MVKKKGVEGIFRQIVFLDIHISLKYSMEEGGWFTKAMRGIYGVSLWKDINKEASHFTLNNSLVIGDGSRVKFWEDVCCREEPFVRCFPCYVCWLVQRGQICRSFGCLTGGRVVEPSV